jgi:hypothetical protein
VTTLALDLVTMGHALRELEETHLGSCTWASHGLEQAEFVTWYATHRDELAKLSGLEALASPNYIVLNSFLQARGFPALLEHFDGLGVVSILDMLVEWLQKADVTEIQGYDSKLGYTTHPAFQIGASGVDVYVIAGRSEPLVSLSTKSGHKLWLTMARQPGTDLDLVFTAQGLLTARKAPHPHWTVGVTVPMLEMEVEPDISWMAGLDTISPRDGYHAIVQARQVFKLRANEVGARAKVATAFATTRGGSPRPRPLVFDQPFIGFFTQPGCDTVPVAVFYADKDSWHTPAGTLEEL